MFTHPLGNGKIGSCEDGFIVQEALNRTDARNRWAFVRQSDDVTFHTAPRTEGYVHAMTNGNLGAQRLGHRIVEGTIDAADPYVDYNRSPKVVRLSTHLQG